MAINPNNRFLQGYVKGSADFNGVSRITIGDVAPLKITGPITFLAWVYLTSNSTLRTIMSKYNAVPNYSYISYFNQTAPTAFSAGISADGSATGFLTGQVTRPPKLNRWYHVAVTYTGTQRIIYIDGINEQQVAYSSGIFDGTSPFIIGSYSGGNYWSGQIADVRVYAQGFTQAQILEIYQTGVRLPTGIVEADLRGWWKLDDGSGSTAIDSSMYGNNGTWSGTAAWSTNVPLVKRTLVSSRTQTAETRYLLPPASTAPLYSGFFNGTTNYISAASDSDITFGDGATDSPFSLSITALFRNFGTRGVIGKASGLLIGEWYIIYQFPTIYLRCIDQSSGGYISGGFNLSSVGSTRDFCDIVFTYSGSGLPTGINCYVDGIPLARSGSTSGVYTAMEPTAVQLQIGWRESTTFFLGNLQNARIYAVELTQSQAMEIHKKNSRLPIGVALSDLRREYLINEGTGTSIADTAGGYTGTVNGSVASFWSNAVSRDVRNG